MSARPTSVYYAETLSCQPLNTSQFEDSVNVSNKILARLRADTVFLDRKKIRDGTHAKNIERRSLFMDGPNTPSQGGAFSATS